ncbi:MAG: OsmC family peroxiredoxin [Chromatiales bacterium]|nr:MAG: OsmC family peroxiredoxin [Chromatiales bacterium]
MECVMSTVKLTYDSDHHVTAFKEPQHKIIAVDCPYTGDGEEFSPANLLSVSLGSCMLLSIGTVAQRAKLDLSGTTVTVNFREVAKPFPHVAAIHYVVDIPHHFDAVDRRRIENAAELCPIKSNIGDNTEIIVKFRYARAEAA